VALPLNQTAEESFARVPTHALLFVAQPPHSKPFLQPSLLPWLASLPMMMRLTLFAEPTLLLYDLRNDELDAVDCLLEVKIPTSRQQKKLSRKGKGTSWSVYTCEDE
jgi:hypothetical protein